MRVRSLSNRTLKCDKIRFKKVINLLSNEMLKLNLSMMHKVWLNFPTRNLNQTREVVINSITINKSFNLTKAQTILRKIQTQATKKQMVEPMKIIQIVKTLKLLPRITSQFQVRSLFAMTPSQSCMLSLFSMLQNSCLKNF